MAEARRCAENVPRVTSALEAPRCDPKCGQREGAHVLLAPSAGASSGGENELDGEKLESSRFVVDSRSEPRIAGAEADLDGLESESFVGVELEPPGVAGVVKVTAPSAASFDGVDVGLRCRSPVVRRSCGWVGRRAIPEAGSDFEAAFTRSENPSVRWNRVNVILHESQSCCMTRTLQNSQSHSSQNSPACSLHGVHAARSVQNSLNSVGDRVVRGRGVCVPGRTKSLSTCTRTGVRRPAVEKLASPQQAPLKLHAETWAGLLCNQGNFIVVRHRRGEKSLLCS